MTARFRTPHPGRDEALVAAGAGLWAGAFVGDVPWLAVVAAVGTAAAALLVRHRPVTGAAVVLAVQVVAIAAGVPPENPFLLPGALLVAYAVGRRCSRRVAVAVIVTMASLDTLHDDGNPGTLVFALVLFGAAWQFGRAVSRRVHAARAARTDLETLRAQDAGDVAAAVVAEERARLAGAAVTVVERAVRRMAGDAAAARPSLDDGLLERIQSIGASAVAELRRLLGLLRSEEQEAAQRPMTDATAGRRGWQGPAALTAGAAALAVVETLAISGRGDLGQGVVEVLLVAAVGLRWYHLLGACLCSAVAVGLGLLLGVHAADGLLSLAVAVLLAWATAVEGGRAWVGLAAVVASTVAATFVRDAANVPLLVGVLGVPVLAGRAWSQSAREESAANDESSDLQRAVAQEVAAARREQRAALARELHDVTSHAVGVMVLHAGAVRAHRERDPARARAALDLLVDVADHALDELARLGAVLAEDGRHDPADLGAALEALVSRIDSTGVRARLEMRAAPSDAEIAAAVLRVAQESLTNVVRHAPGSTVVVRVADSPAGLEVSVVDDGARDGTAGHGAGFGLVGLDERVRALGGELTAGPCPEGGFRVVGLFPPAAVRR